jgi:hypothetical protein
LVSEKLKTLEVKNVGYVPKTKKNLSKQRVTTSHNPKNTTQEPKTLTENHDDSPV